jgi:hypothetical protein
MFRTFLAATLAVSVAISGGMSPKASPTDTAAPDGLGSLSRRLLDHLAE